MKAMTRKFLEEAFAGESQAHMRYLIFAEIAEEEGFTNVARLFRAIAYAEFVHARNHYKALKLAGKTVDNLGIAAEGETYEAEEMYPIFNAAAKIQDEKEAERSTHFALSAEKVHAELYAEARKKVEEGRDFEFDSVHICPVCGYTVLNDPPEFCPICGAKGESFVKF